MPKKHIGRGNRTKGNTRTQLTSGPLGDTFFDSIESAAKRVGESFTDYIRRAVLARMKRDGVPFKFP